MDYISAAGTAKLINLPLNGRRWPSDHASGYVVYALAIPAIFLLRRGRIYRFQARIEKRGAKVIRYVMLGVLALLVGKMAFNFFMK